MILVYEFRSLGAAPKGCLRLVFGTRHGVARLVVCLPSQDSKDHNQRHDNCSHRDGPL